MRLASKHFSRLLLPECVCVFLGRGVKLGGTIQGYPNVFIWIQVLHRFPRLALTLHYSPFSCLSFSGSWDHRPVPSGLST